MWWGFTAMLLVGCRFGFEARPDGSPTGTGDARVTTVDADAAITANIAFVTSTTHAPGVLGGLAAADAICGARASEAGLPGTFMAWLSTSTVDAQTRFAGARGWVRVDGLPVADQVADLAAGNLIYPIALDEHGNDLAAGAYSGGVWAATATGNGIFSGPDCVDYTNPGDAMLVGLAGANFFEWSDRAQFACTQEEHLYCLGTDRVVPIAAPVATGRLAFVSTGLFTPNTGIAAADAICASEAATAGRGGTFLAALPDGAAAVSRFDTTGPTWIRADGVRLAVNAADVLGERPAAPLDLTIDGTKVDELVITGCDSPLFVTVGEDCDGWTNAGGGGNYGNTGDAGGGMFNDTSAACSMPLPVYCFEL